MNRDIGVLAKHLGPRRYAADATHDIVWNGGPGLSSAVGHSSLHAETAARGVML